MILIGQYNSPFVRRVGIALTLYGMAFEHRPWSVLDDADRIAALNPLIRVPVLVLDDGFVLTDSHIILDHLDSLADEPLFPHAEPERHHALKVATLAMGLAEKAVSLFYERQRHAVVSQRWATRCQRQIGGVLAALEADRASRPAPYWFGERLGHADIAVACAWRFVGEAHGGVVDLTGCPALTAHGAALEATAAFRLIAQPFIAAA